MRAYIIRDSLGQIVAAFSTEKKAGEALQTIAARHYEKCRRQGQSSPFIEADYAVEITSWDSFDGVVP